MAGDSLYFKQKQKKIKKGLWSPEEDQKLFSYIIKFGVGSWTSVPQLAGLERCGKSCRLRWVNYLRPDLKRGGFSQQEQHIILALHQLLGNRWAQIATKLPGRTDNEIKNFWNSCLKKKLIKNGIDPNTHKPTVVDPKEVINENKSNKFECKPVLPNIYPISPSPSSSILPMTDEFEQAAFPHLTYKDNFMTTSNFFLGEFETGIDPVSLEYCNDLLAHEYDQQMMNCETTSLLPSSFDFSDNLLTSRSVMESSICSNYSNMVNNHSAELLMNNTKYEECPHEAFNSL